MAYRSVSDYHRHTLADQLTVAGSRSLTVKVTWERPAHEVVVYDGKVEHADGTASWPSHREPRPAETVELLLTVNLAELAAGMVFAARGNKARTSRKAEGAVVLKCLSVTPAAGGAS